MQKGDQHIEGYKAGKRLLTMMSMADKPAIDKLFEKMMNERNNADPLTDFKTEAEYDDRMDWLDGFLDYFEEYLK
tara:strand:+ start:8398 stop:8622 length:225 start_codon:yes stop_codon:yes gene_type:complete